MMELLRELIEDLEGRIDKLADERNRLHREIAQKQREMQAYIAEKQREAQAYDEAIEKIRSIVPNSPARSRSLAADAFPRRIKKALEPDQKAKLRHRIEEFLQANGGATIDQMVEACSTPEEPISRRMVSANINQMRSVIHGGGLWQYVPTNDD